MASPEIFQYIGSTLDAAMATYVSATSSKIIADFKPFAVGVTTAYFMIVGYLIAIGQIEQPARSFFVTLMKTVFVGSFALNVDTYTHWVVSGLQGLEEGITQAFSGTTGGNVYSVADEALGKGADLAAEMWERSNDTFSIGRAIGETLIAAVIAICTVVLVAPAGAMIIVAKFWLAVMLGIGPFFLMCALWPSTRKFFDSWFAMLTNHIFVIALTGTVLLLAMKIFTAFVAGIDVNGEHQSTLFVAMMLGVTTLVMGKLLLHTSNVAAQLSGGISDAAITFGQTISPALGVARAVNSRSTRLDPRTGGQTASTRLEHLAMGRSVFARSPAYRAGLKERLNEAWRKPGGKVGRSGGGQ